jgi:hypothetical protein
MGSNLITRIVMFSIFINLSIGVIVYGVLDAHENQIFDFTITHEYLLDGQDYGNDFQSELEKSVHPSGMLDDKSDQIYRILDTISLGFVYRFISTECYYHLNTDVYRSISPPIIFNVSKSGIMSAYCAPFKI